MSPVPMLHPTRPQNLPRNATLRSSIRYHLIAALVLILSDTVTPAAVLSPLPRAREARASTSRRRCALCVAACASVMRCVDDLGRIVAHPRSMLGGDGDGGWARGFWLLCMCICALGRGYLGI
ncbi:hypothetical protein DENSPDRAFT_497342 [Dentipellis sp. KUC8613]|nr:hypothetical protein DENSPDRAFT_497342 [Dentipellis sp. KUC8613]